MAALRPALPTGLFRRILALGVCRSFTIAAMATGNAQSPAVPRLSASVIVLNDHNEVLLIHRTPKASAFAGVHVFPGGHYDAGQDSSLPMTAVRETFEEAGLLIASPDASTRLSTQTFSEARRAVHLRHTPFRTFLDAHRLTVPEHSLLPFTQWVTPVGAPRRFHAHFFIYFWHGTASTSMGQTLNSVPTSDGGREVLSTRFVHPQDSLTEFVAGKIVLFPPQFYILSTLAAILPKGKGSLVEREKLRVLSRGTFGRMVFNPRFMPEVDEQGHHVLTYEGDETRGGPKGRRHRVLCKDAKSGGAFAGMTLERNFDIFFEIEMGALLEKSRF